MGYCYQGRKLCCDVCGTAGARKKKCPYGWCQALAVCPNCSKTKKDALRQEHETRGCEKASAEFHGHLALEAALLAEGKAVRCSAKNVGETGRVHVLFKLAGGLYEGRYMSDTTYHALPYRAPATPEEYAKYGEVLPAPSEYENGNVTKRVA